MGLLDDLERQAETARARRARADAGSRERAAGQAARLAPALAGAQRYFEQLAAHLVAIERVVETRYDIADVGMLDGLVQTGYATSSEELAGHNGFRFHFRCVGRVPVEGRFAAAPLAESVLRRLRDAGLTTRRVDEGGRVIVLRVEPQVPVSVSFAMDVEGGMLQFTARNLFGIGVQKHRFAPARVDTALLDAIAHCVLREPSGFGSLTGNTVSDEQRALLARDAARHQRRRDAELGGPIRRAWFRVSEPFRRKFRGQ